MRPLCAALAALACTLHVWGCAQKRTQPSAQSASLAATTPVATSAPTDSTEKRPRFGESVVYVDGRPVGVLRASELPPGLKARHVDLGGGYSTTRYGFLDYARALGVDATRIKAMHLYGGMRIAVVERAELTRVGDRISFEFVQGTRGKPRVDWPSSKVHVNTHVDMVSNVAFYVDKDPPHLRDHQLVMPDGTTVKEKVPYAPEEQGSGTRVYIDGALVGTVKRKKITNDLLVPGDAKAKQGAPTPPGDRFSLLGYATALRVDAKQVKALDVLAGDDVIARLNADEARALSFHVPARNRGQAVIDLVRAADSTSTPARISAIQIWTHLAPPPRPVVELEDASDAALLQGAGGGGGDEDL